MPERATHHEHHKPRPQAEHAPEQRHFKANSEHNEHKRPQAEHAPLDELEKRVKHEAKTAAEAAHSEKEAPQGSSAHVGRELKQQTLQRTLRRIRKQLSAPDRAFSKVIHQPVVDSISQITGKTIARPSGLLGGSICAFIGSSAFLWMAKYYGFNYNYLMFALLFVAGFAVGMILELLILAFRRKQA